MTMREAAVILPLCSRWQVTERTQMTSRSPCYSYSVKKEVSYWMLSGNTRRWKCFFLTKQKTEVRIKSFVLMQLSTNFTGFITKVSDKNLFLDYW